MAYRIIPRDEWGAVHGTGWGSRPLPATGGVFIHYPGAKAPPGPEASLEDDAAYVRYLEQVGFDRFSYADRGADGQDLWPGEQGAGLSYSYVIARSGRIFAGHDPALQSSHTKGRNFDAMAYCVLTDGDSPANNAQLAAVAWLAHEQVRRGELASPTITGGHRDVVATVCPTDPVYEQIPTMQELTRGGPGMAPRQPTATDMRQVNDQLKSWGLVMYCDTYNPSCPSHGGTWPHIKNSRHNVDRAVDFGYGAAPVSDLEALVVEVAWDMLRARFRHLRLRGLWNIGPGDHEDHFHVDDMLGQPGWVANVRPRAGVRARDGRSLFVPLHLFGGAHVPPTNHGFPMRHIADFQAKANRYFRQVGVKTVLEVDGYFGTNTGDAALEVQKRLGFTGDDRDRIPGNRTMKALDAFLAGETNGGLTPAEVLAFQRVAAKIIVAGKALYRDKLDGEYGPNTAAAALAVQTWAGITRDKIPGVQTLAAANRWLAEQTAAAAPDPTPPPAPAPPPVPDGPRLAGATRFDTFAEVARQAPPARQRKVYLAASDMVDAVAGAAVGDGVVLLVRRGHNTLPSATVDILRDLDVAEVVALGATGVVTPTAARDARRAAGI